MRELLISILKKVDPKLLVLLGAAFVAVGTYWQAFNSSKKLDDLREENKNLNKQIYDNLIGANSFCFLEMFITPWGKVAISVRHKGLYHLKNVEISIINTDLLLESQINGDNPANIGITPANYHGFGNAYQTKVSLLTKGATKGLEGFDISESKQKSFNVIFTSDNGNVWYQRILLRRVKDYPPVIGAVLSPDSYIYASQVYTAQWLKLDDFTGLRREDTIISEGTNWTFGEQSPDSSNPYIWNGFPLNDNESQPFNENTIIHWEDANIIRTGIPYKIIYNPVSTRYLKGIE